MPDEGFIILDVTDSTNEEVKKLAVQGYPEFTAVMAREQAAGKGRRGRQFFSPRDAGLYLSILLRPDTGSGFDPADITSMAAVAVSRSVEEVTGVRNEIKWVNDIICRGKKVCGILAEAGSGGPGSALSYVVLGIGINLFEPRGGFPEELKDIAGSVLESRDTDDKLKTDLAGRIISSFREIYSDPERAYVSEYKERCSTPGKDVIVISGAGKRNAKALSLDDKCRLKVRYENGEEELLSYGEVSVRPSSIKT